MKIIITTLVFGLLFTGCLAKSNANFDYAIYQPTKGGIVSYQTGNPMLYDSVRARQAALAMAWSFCGGPFEIVAQRQRSASGSTVYVKLDPLVVPMTAQHSFVEVGFTCDQEKK